MFTVIPGQSRIIKLSNFIFLFLIAQMNNILHPLPPKKLSADKPSGSIRRPHKRKLATPLHREEESSCCSSDEEESPAAPCRGRKRYPVLSPASSCNSSAGIAVSASPKPVPHDDSDGGPTAVPPTSSAPAASGNTSVKDLENAMSKHLPSSGATIDKTASPLLHQPTDFSTDALLKQQQQRSTIQWIGAHHLNQLGHHQHPHQPYGPASALLKQLYANRESVIRANVHAAASGLAANGGRTSSPGIPPYYTGADVNHHGPLPTPPGSEGSFGEQFSLSAHNQKPSDGAFGPLAYGGAGATYSVDYHTAAMTPPSSVSPRDKHQQQIQQHSAAFDPGSAYQDVLRHPYLNAGAPPSDMPTQPLPLKPQAYTPMHHHHHTLDAYTSASGLDQSQFYHSAGFHLYHPPPNKGMSAAPVYSDGIKNPSNWYPTPS